MSLGFSSHQIAFPDANVWANASLFALFATLLIGIIVFISYWDCNNPRQSKLSDHYEVVKFSIRRVKKLSQLVNGEKTKQIGQVVN